MSGQFVIERLGPFHDRASFSCGVPSLDRYLRQSARQDIRRRFANCFVAVERSAGTVAAFYTLSAASIPLSELAGAVVKRLPHYPMVPAALIGRLAVDNRFRGQRLGEAMLVDAADRVLDSSPAAFALVVEAKDTEAASFYKRYEFRPLNTKPMTLFLPIAAIDARRTKDASS